MENSVIKLIIGKPIRCKNGHVIGLVEKRSGVHRLHVLRMSEVDLKQDENEVGMVPESWCIGEMTEGVVRCSICGYRRRFVQASKKNGRK